MHDHDIYYVPSDHDREFSYHDHNYYMHMCVFHVMI